VELMLGLAALFWGYAKFVKTDINQYPLLAL